MFTYLYHPLIDDLSRSTKLVPRYSRVTAYIRFCQQLIGLKSRGLVQVRPFKVKENRTVGIIKYANG